MLRKDLGARIKDALRTCLKSLKKDSTSIEVIPIQLEIPKDKVHGDISTNLAFKLSRHLKENPNKIATLIVERLKPIMAKRGFSPFLERVEVMPPGFINFWFGKEYLYDVLGEIEREGRRYGKCNVGGGKKLQIEFVSANPTGPLTVAHGRQAAAGDSLANILGLANYRVKREYYINDEGSQIDLLGESIRARYLEAIGEKTAFPKDGYKGEYIVDVADKIKGKNGDRYKNVDVRYFVDFGVQKILEIIKSDLKDFGVKFDMWYSQKSLTKSGKLKRTLKFLGKKGYLYKRDGALWFSSKQLGDDKDRVVVKGDGSFTYLAPDIAYHRDKFKRGFNKVIDIWGPDHHGYIGRLTAAIRALGHSPEEVSVLLVQLTTLYRGGEIVPMSTRQGQFVTLREVMKEVGRDATRFFFLMRKTNSHLDFDLELAKKTSFDNPVYYIQYAHARASNILKFVKEKYPRYGNTKFVPRLLVLDEEIAILRLLRKFPYIIMTSAQCLEPYFLVLYLQGLATVFHGFYAKHRVVTDDMVLTRTRLKLVSCAKRVLSQGLSLLGVSAPTKM